MTARYAVGDAPIYLMPAYMVMAGWLAAGAEAACRGLSAARSLSPRLRRTLAAALLAGLTVALPARLLLVNWSDQDLSGAWASYDAGRVLLLEVERNSLLLLSGDFANGIALYVHVAENLRPDVRLVWTELAAHPWYDGSSAPGPGVGRRRREA